jgi:hypothetical protein
MAAPRVRARQRFASRHTAGFPSVRAGDSLPNPSPALHDFTAH